QLSGQGEPRRPDDPAASVATKMAALRDYLEACGVRVPAAAVLSAVVLTNPRLTLGPELARRRELGRLADLADLLAPRILPQPPRFWGGLRRLFGLETAVAPHFADFAAVTKVLDRLPTWDVVHLYGGRIVKGDVVGPNLDLASGQTFTRRDATAVQFHIPRDWLFGWFVT